MSKLKTVVNDANVEYFINSVANEEKIKDSHELLKIFTKITKEKPKMWGSSIIGFGQYHYKSDKSSQEGDWLMTGFSPRKQNLTIYIIPGFSEYEGLLTKIGKHKTSVSCLYINKLSDIDINVLEDLITKSYEDMKRLHP